MNKDWFEKETEKIEVSKDDVFQAISNGMKDGRRLKKRKKAFKLSAVFSSAAASLVLASGFLFAPMNHALAQVPLLGSIYEHLSVGSELFASDLVTELDEKATSKGVDVTITNAYYDGNVIGVTFEAKGDKLTIENMDLGNRPAAGYSYHIFDGKDRNQWSASSTQLKETNDGTFIGAIEFYNDKKELPEEFTLPLTFTHMADVFGKWKFEVPVKQIPAEKLEVAGTSTFEDGAYELSVNTITKGKATTLIEYQVKKPKDGKLDYMNLTVTDDQKQRLMKSNVNPIERQFVDGNWIVTYRELFTSKIDEEADFLMIAPKLHLDEQEIFQSLNTSVPFQVQSERFDTSITVNEVKMDEDELVFNYTLNNKDSLKKNTLQNFATRIKIVPTAEITFDEYGYIADKNDLLGHATWEQTSEIVDKEKMQFQTRIPINNPKSFDMKDYSLMVPFGALTINNAIKLDPVKIELK
ncbi:DUF4179 domain-containing protein [Pseudalkalibacillus sp. Hm43]|uniref:DUF4179 domain-containing protein n=1 Tax=Pseudalkalibacillus sp. Hm43 TaxID=3450742 RepID=UPI003F44246D